MIWTTLCYQFLTDILILADISEKIVHLKLSSKLIINNINIGFKKINSDTKLKINFYSIIIMLLAYIIYQDLKTHLYLSLMEVVKIAQALG